MYNFTDLIAKSYLKYTKEKDANISVFFYQEQYQIRPEARAKFIYSEEQFYNELIKKIDGFINASEKNYDVDLTYFPDAYIEPKDFKSWAENDLKEKQDFYDYAGIDYILKPFNWEKIENAKHLTEALINGLNLEDSITIISPSKEIQADDLVLRKSKLEYLKTEAIKARNANDIRELDITPLSPNMVIENDSPYNLNNPQLTWEVVVDKVTSKALEFIKPLGGYNIQDKLLDSADMDRLNSYVASLIKKGNLQDLTLLPFPKINLPNQFIRKTIHNVYLTIGKKNKDEFIQLIHLFKQFEDTEITTTNSKFSTYEGNYDEKLMEISF